LDEIESNDKIIESQKFHQKDLKQQIKQLEGQITTLQGEL